MGRSSLFVAHSFLPPHAPLYNGRIDSLLTFLRATAMSDTHLLQVLRPQLDDLRAKGLFKRERRLQGPQGSAIQLGGRGVLNFCANNYLGLANHPAIVEAAHDGLRRWGYGLSSVRFICGTQDVHKDLESAVARFFLKEDAIL